MQMGRMLVYSMIAPYRPEQHRDEYEEKLLAAIQRKIDSQGIAAAAEPKGSLVNLIDALEKSLAMRSSPIKSEDWISKLKLDGIRCIAYLKPGETDLRNKRNRRLLPSFPDLDSLHEGVRAACILDGKLIIAGADGRPDFETLQARSMMSDLSRIRLGVSI